MAKNLLIVESPAKAKTIEKYLGSDFVVKSSMGHIRDLIKDSKDQKAIDVDNKYKANYEISPDKFKVVKELREWVKKVDEVWLATDEDREGEAISWHLAEVLNLNVKTTKRIAFHEITKPALLKAVQNPRLIDLDLVNAQQSRRVLDRLVGFELSELLWRKVKSGLSAGRVQSVAVRLVVDREREIEEFNTAPFFRIGARFNVLNNEKNIQVSAKLYDLKQRSEEHKFEKEGDAKAFLNKCLPATYTVEEITVKPTKRSPAPPFTTSTLQQEASRKLYFPVSKTMRVAQALYEAGHITYMRTDSTNLSAEALKNIEKAIVGNYGQNYHKYRTYSSKKGAQEAHEAIRPTYMEKQNVSGDRDEQRLYELIWKRAIASQMADAQLEKTTVDVKISTVNDALLVAVGEVLKFDGFLKVYLESKDEEEDEDAEDAILPPMKKGQKLDLKEMEAVERYTRPPYRYTEAGLVKKLEELGIGRPSTYAPTIERIMNPTRGYITKESREGSERPYRVLMLHASSPKKEAHITESTKKEVYGADKNKLFASDMGKQVSDFLVKYFDKIMNYRFTAGIEDQLDEVSEGKLDTVKMLDAVYKPFHETVLTTRDEAERVTGERILGKHPISGLTVLVRIGRYGPVAQIGSSEELGENEKSIYANLHREQSIDTITMDDVMDLFKFPKTLGTYKGFELSVNEGRYGPYVKFDEKFISLPKNVDPNSISFEEAVVLIDAKLIEDAPVGYFQGKPITKGSGRFGPFVKWENLYVSITKGSGFQLETINESQAILLIEQKIDKEASKYLRQWENQELFIENGRWGPFIRSGKKSYKLIDANGKKITAEEVPDLTVEQVIAMVEEQGGKVKKPKAAKTTKPTAGKSTATKSTTKTVVKKTVKK
jgi:DNA topoisomerase-1